MITSILTPGNAASFSKMYNFHTVDGTFYTSKTGNLNLIPLGLVEFEVNTYDCKIHIPSTYFVNRAGNVIISQTSGVPHCGFIVGTWVESDLYINPSVANAYSKIIVVGAPENKVTIMSSEGLWGEVIGKERYRITGSWSSDYPVTVKGTLMFYGIK